MNSRKSVPTLSVFSIALTYCLGMAATACSSEAQSPSLVAEEVGGSAAKGGQGNSAPGSGGSSAQTGGSSSSRSDAAGGSAQGGSASSTNQSTAAGGLTTSAGGKTGSGGISASGGKIGTGGDSASGGKTGVGGNSGLGGTTATGGNSASGGKTGVGGANSNPGGATGVGGKTGTGGTTAVGGKTGAAGTTAAGVGAAAGSTGTGLPTSGYCPAAEPCRISPLGDSITEGMGWNYPTGGGYRSKLFGLGIKDAKNFTFVGTRSNGPETVDGKPFPKNHEGTSGITIQDLQKKLDQGVLTGSAVKPHIILLHLGTNNLSGGSVTQNSALMASFLDKTIKDCPDALIVVAKIIPFNGSEKGFNDALPALVTERANKGAHIILVDQSAGFDSKADIADGVHPNEGGYAKMAAVWYKAISQYLH